MGVYETNPPNTPAGFGNKSFAIGRLGTWTLEFGGPNAALGLDSVSFGYNETEGPIGFTATVYDIGGNILETRNVANGVGTVTFSGLSSAVYKLTITDVGGDGYPGGDNVQLDNLAVSTIESTIPEPSTYLLVGSALAGLAYRRRRA
jgi:hypothetical protein